MATMITGAAEDWFLSKAPVGSVAHDLILNDGQLIVKGRARDVVRFSSKVLDLLPVKETTARIA